MVKTKRDRWGKKFEDTRDWKVYHEELIIRGEFFFDFDFLENWDDELVQMNKDKVGRPYEYPDSLFVWLSPMHNFLDSRKLEGALRKLSYYIPRLSVCNHSIIIERLNKLELTLDIDKSKKYRVAVDVTGNKLSNRGEYIRHKWKVKRGWIKVNLVIDRFTKELLDVQVALEECADYELAKKHLANLQDVKIEDLAGDGAYYVEEFYKLLQRFGIRPVIKMPKNALNKGLDPMHRAVREMEQLGGYDSWRDKFKYGHRWNIEGYNSSTKRIFGECVRSQKEENCLKEAGRKFIDYERMKKYDQKRSNSLQFSKF
ncbi:IS5/IS1182 family transposase [Candidatus Woesearchaeota archaeon CG10_big_fil_rev_8_21_14_0_10_32_24]|nr:MAG: IS5/IS1182 family transposase [Candidatus Woesearchaeota archaeon CG10_big_fil_rev_8_21_14_0_10_32_24]